MMPLKKYAVLLFLSIYTSIISLAQNESFAIVTESTKATIVYDKHAVKLDSIAAHLLAADIERVTGYQPKVVDHISDATGNVIVIGNVQSATVKKLIGASALSAQLPHQWECFGLTIIDNPSPNIFKALVIAGSDTRGTAYGVFTLSEKIGVSPWYWWADAPVQHQNELIIHQTDFVSKSPAVKYRGIFINDEDWGLQPWAAKTFEPETGDIGPKTYAKVFELLLRLKANLIWPAMHPSTKAFFYYPGNVRVAEDYQIVVGSSHAEPMLRNNVGEWDEKTMGHFNYFTNKKTILKYWEDRVKETKGMNAMYSMGMRGVHDGQMEGVKDLKDAVPVIEKIIGEERQMLSDYIHKDVTTIPQVLTPYKEVLEIYDHGLKVPDDITLVWPDDNYGYIARLNNEKEKNRMGGAGVYYHASYWGRPHDYLWLPSTHPSLLREEMLKAYETGANRVWVLNVGDIKPQEYNMQQFLDMAYNPSPFKESSYTRQHLQQWLAAIFGDATAKQIQPLLWQYFDLAFQRKPEFMGWSQTEPTTKTTYTSFNHFYYGDEAQQRLDQYDALANKVRQLRQELNGKEADAFFQLLYYPIMGASWMNKKFLYRDKAYLYAKQNRISAYDYADASKAAYDSIIQATNYYNNELAGGKWQYIMSMQPRALPVYQEPVLPVISIDSSHNWNIAPEGYVSKDSSLLKNNTALMLPAFDNYQQQQYFVDVFLSKHQSIHWKATASNNWIRLSKSEGELGAKRGKNQERIWVAIDWDKLTTSTANGSISIEAAGQQLIVQVKVNKYDKAALTGYKGFIENNGYVAMKATEFNSQTATPASYWKPVNGLGYTGNVIEAFPLRIDGPGAIDTNAIMQKNGSVAYDFYTLTAAAPDVYVYALPSHPLNNNCSVRYAISIDDGPLQITDIKTYGRSEAWKQNVLRNRAERKIAMPMIQPGKHTLRIFCIDPGVMLDEIRIDLGGLKSAYSTIPETKILAGAPK